MRLAGPDLNRLRWRCRRGMRELDLILGGFLESGYGRLSAEQQRMFADLLEFPDQTLLDWLMGRATPTEIEAAALVKRIRDRSEA